MGVVSSLIVVIEREKKKKKHVSKKIDKETKIRVYRCRDVRRKKERKKEKKRAWPLSLSASVDRIWTGLYKERKRRISESRPNQIPLLFTIVAFRLPDYILFLF